MRILSIIALCSDQDDFLLKQAVASVKESQSAPGAPAYFEASCEKYLMVLQSRAAKVRKERDAIDGKQRSFFGALFSDSSKQALQARAAKKVITDMTSHVVLPAGENYLDVSTGKKSKVLVEKEAPRKVFVFSCGGGSFAEYEQIRDLNEQLNTLAAVPESDAAIDQVIYGADFVYSATEFYSQLRQHIK